MGLSLQSGRDVQEDKASNKTSKNTCRQKEEGKPAKEKEQPEKWGRHPTRRGQSHGNTEEHFRKGGVLCQLR